MTDLEHDLRSIVDAGPSIGAEEARARAQVRQVHPPARRTLLVPAAFVVVTVLVIAGLVIARSDGRGNDRVSVPAQVSPGPSPSEIAALTTDGRVVVLDAAGAELRTITAYADPESGHLSVAPDGTVYFDERSPSSTIAEQPADDTAERTVLGQGCCVRYPFASPDGRWLAFSGVPNQSDAGRDILLQSRTSAPGGYERRWSSTSTLDQGIEILGWTPDSSGVVFIDRDAPDPRPRILDIDAEQTASLDDQPILDVPASTTFTGYRGSTGTVLVISDSTPPGRAIAWDPTSGRSDTLFTLDGIDSIASDPIGDHLLVVAHDRLYRWTTGDSAPTRIADGIVTAAWYPTTGSTGSQTVTTTTSTGSTATTPSPAAAGERPPHTTADGRPLLVQVLNGSDVQGDATRRSNDLKARGWLLLPPVNTPEPRDGSAIACADGFDSNAQQIHSDLLEYGLNTTIEPLADPLPLGFDTAAACYVILGS